MKLRLARKIWKRALTDDDLPYSRPQLLRAAQRIGWRNLWAWSAVLDRRRSTTIAEILWG